MIQTAGQLELVREQLALVETALASLRDTVKPKSEERFRLMAESYVEQMISLRAQIDAYLGVGTVTTTADVVIGLEGEEVRLGEAPASLVTRALDTFRRGLQSIVETRQSLDAPQRVSGRRKLWIERLCDPPVLGLAHGSLQICLGEPDTGELFTQEDRELYRKSLDLLVAGLAWATATDTDRIDAEAPAPQVRHEVLSAVRKLVPPRGGAVQAVSFHGRLVRSDAPLRLTQETRGRVDAELKRMAVIREETRDVGTIREVDLDRNTFILRDREAASDLDCEYDEKDEPEVIAFLNARVIVSGTMRTSTKTKRHTLEVDTIEPSTSPDQEEL